VNKLQWIFFGIQMFFTYGPKLWGWFQEIIKQIKEQKKLSPEQQFVMFRLSVERKWVETKGSAPSDQQVRRAFICATQRVNGRFWRPLPEEIRVAGIDRFYA